MAKRKPAAPKHPRALEKNKVNAGSAPSAQISTQRVIGFPIVGLGASAGGLEAFEQFFRSVKPNCGLAFVLVPHLDPAHASILTEILRRSTAMPVVEAQDQMAVAPNHVYVIPPNRDMAVFHGALRQEDSTVFHTQMNILWMADSGPQPGTVGKPPMFRVTLSDITERKQATKDSLQQSEMLFRAAFDGSAVPMSLTASDGKLIKVNAAYCEMMGYSEMELAQLNFYEFSHPDDFPINRAGVQRMLNGEQASFRMEKRYIRKDRRVIWGDMSSTLVRDANGQPLYMVTHVQDITERKRAEEQLREVTRRLTFHVDHSPLAVIEWGADMRLVRWSGEAEHIFGWKADEVLGKRMEDFRWIYDEDQAQVAEVSHELETGTNPQRFSANRNYRKDGSIAHCEWYNSSLLDESGKLCSILSLVLDVTARKRAEETLREREEQLRIFVEHSPAAIAMFDRGMKYIAVSRRWLSDYHLGEQMLIGRSHYEVFPDLPERWKAIHQRCLNGAVETCDEDPYPRADGSTDWIRWEIRPWQNSQGQIGGIILFSEVITERKRTEVLIKASLAEKEVLLREIHHRVKNNLQVISSLVSLQADNLTDDRMRAVFGDVRDRVRTMALVHEKLYQTDNLVQLNFADYAASLLQYLWRTHGVMAEKVRLDLAVAPLTLPIETAMHCGLILNELASNTLKHAFPHGRGGSVTVAMDHDATSGAVCLRVRDNGVGLPAELDWRQTRSLGLRLVQMLSEQLHGTVETGPGPGTEFRIRFSIKGLSA